MSAIGKVFALASVGLGGVALGIIVERSTSSGGRSVDTNATVSPLPITSGGLPCDHDAARFGLPSDGTVRVMRGYIASLNYERRIPNWVLERIVYEPVAGSGKSLGSSGSDDGGSAGDAPCEVVQGKRESSAFYADALVPAAFRVTPADYSGARGMSRGHLAPAQFHKRSQEEMNETFNMSANIVPQDMTVNAVDWLRVEGMVRKLSKEVERGLWVVTGPVFMPTYNVTDDAWRGKRVVQYEVIGNVDVAVPTHLFKVVLGEDKRGARSIAAFVLPNAPIAEEQPLTQYQVSPRYVEQLTGLQLFPLLPDAGGVASLPDLCRMHKCDARTSPLFRHQRYVGQLRLAKTVSQLQDTFRHLLESGKVDEPVCKEFEAKMKELTAPISR